MCVNAGFTEHSPLSRDPVNAGTTILSDLNVVWPCQIDEIACSVPRSCDGRISISRLTSGTKPANAVGTSAQLSPHACIAIAIRARILPAPLTRQNASLTISSHRPTTPASIDANHDNGRHGCLIRSRRPHRNSHNLESATSCENSRLMPHSERFRVQSVQQKQLVE